VLGEGLHETYANRPEFRGNNLRARLEVFCILQDRQALAQVQAACEGEFNRLWDEYRDDIAAMSAPIREKYNDLRRRGTRAAAESLMMPDAIEVPRQSPTWTGHLYVDERGKFGWNVNGWEEAVLKKETGRTGFAGFLRNEPRKPWGLCVPYGAENENALYPDLLVFRRIRGRVTIDILEPHGDHFADGLPKAQGLARYAAVHGESFGRIEAIRVVGDRIDRLDLQDSTVRGKVLRMTTPEQFQGLYTEYGRNV
jgi:type III restriction enzyme